MRRKALVAGLIFPVGFLDKDFRAHSSTDFGSSEILNTVDVFVGR